MKLTDDFKLISLNSQVREPIVTISKYGVNFSKAAAECLKFSEYALVYLNDRSKMIAITPASKTSNEAVAFYKPKNKTAKNPSIQSSRFLSILSKLCQWDIENKTYYVKPEYLEDGKGIYLDLNKAEEKERRIFGRGE
ncbi:TPA: hypothetical protein QFL15_001926 [Enterococcus faecium]